MLLFQNLLRLRMVRVHQANFQSKVMQMDSHQLLFTIASCHQLLKSHARSLASGPDVISVTHWPDLLTVDGAFRLEEFVDAELSNGEAISWHLEVTLLDDTMVIEADVRRIHREGQDLIEAIVDTRFESITEGVDALPTIVQKLCARDSIR